VTGDDEKGKKPVNTITIDESRIAVVRHSNTKQGGPRKKWREIEFAQLAVQFLYGASPSKNIDHSKLTREVNDFLRDYPDYRATGLGEISRPTVVRALKKVSP